MTSHPYSPATDATPRDTDLDPHAHCRAREAAVTRALAAADRLAKRLVEHTKHNDCAACGQRWHHLRNCELAAYLAAREETR